jgi:hypothetical protein
MALLFSLLLFYYNEMSFKNTVILIQHFLEVDDFHPVRI